MSATRTEVQPRKSKFSFVDEHAPADTAAAREHFLARLAFETDPADVHLDLERSPDRIQVIDVRSAEAYEACHVPGAINLPHRGIDDDAVATLERERTLIVYCWGPGCNGAQKGAARFAALGFKVKEMIGGIEYWRREGYEVEGNEGAAAPMHG